MNTVLAKRVARFGAIFFNNLLFYIALFMFIAISDVLGLSENIANTLLIIVAILMIAIQIFFMFRYQQTIAKKLLGIQVVSWATREPLSVHRYVLREIVTFIGYQLGILFIIDAIMIFTTKEQRTLTDIIFSTIVIEKI